MDRNRRACESTAKLHLTVFIALAASLLSWRGPARAQEPVFLRGDANADGRASISDALMLRRFLFNGEIPPPCEDAADTTDEALLDLSDGIRLITSLFLGGSILPEPYPLVGVDPTVDTLPCASYTVQEPEFTEDVIRIGEVTASAGDAVEIPIFVTSTVEVEAFQVVVAYDPALLEVQGPQRPSFLGTFYDSPLFRPAGPEFSVVNPDPQAGVFLVSVIGHLTDLGYEIPPGEDRLVVKVPARVSLDAPPGATIVLAPTNGEAGAGTGVHRLLNELTHRGTARYASLLPRLIPGRVRIVGPDLIDFLRTDANADGQVDIADPLFTLAYLFLGGDGPECLDAADADDSGIIDISDPISTLNGLFQGNGSIPRACAVDATGDSLGGCGYNRCGG